MVSVETVTEMRAVNLRKNVKKAIRGISEFSISLRISASVSAAVVGALLVWALKALVSLFFRGD